MKYTHFDISCWFYLFGKKLTKNQSNKMASEEESCATTFYREKLANLLKDNCCENQKYIKLKKAKYSERLELQEKLRRNQAAISTCEQVICEKEQTIKECQEKLKVLMINGRENSTHDAKNDDQYMLAAFQEIGDTFTPDQLNDLCAFRLDSKKDASFITAMIKFSYKDIDELKTKSFTGTSRSNIHKTAISPQKLSLWKTMFQKRLQYSGTRDSVARLKKFRTLVNSSIQNCTRATKIQDCPDKNDVTVIISNSENDLLVLKKIQRTFSVGQIKVLF